MPTPENPNAAFPTSAPRDAADATRLSDLEKSFRGLRTLLNLVLVSLIVLTISLFGFVVRELKFVRRQVDDSARIVDDYKKNVEPRLNDLQSRLHAYSQTHPEFAPIFVKYFGNVNPTSGGQGNGLSQEKGAESRATGSKPPPIR